jgi:hypothetical protein
VPATLSEAPDGAVTVVVPGGRELALRPTGHEDDVFLLETAEGMVPSERGTALLGRCLRGGAGVARALTVGDREALLLELRRLSIGETLECVLPCPNESCGERMEFTVAVRDLLLPPYGDTRATYETVVENGGVRYRVLFRIPTSEDLDRAAKLALSDPESGTREIFERCVLDADRDGMNLSVDALPDAVRSGVSEAMGDFDPQAEIELDLRCPACDAGFSALFDAAAFLLGELDERATRLLRDVHTLALSYHWSEAQILGLSSGRRAKYVDMVTESRSRALTP